MSEARAEPERHVLGVGYPIFDRLWWWGKKRAIGIWLTEEKNSDDLEEEERPSPVKYLARPDNLEGRYRLVLEKVE